MAKPEWGTKRTCPECGTRFYDLGRNDPAVCIDCGNEWVPEPVLKSKQIIVEQAPAAAKIAVDGADEVDDVVEIEAVVDDVDADVDAPDIAIESDSDPVAAVVVPPLEDKDE